MREGLSKVIRTPSLRDDCKKYMNTELYKYFITILVSIFVGVINFLIRVIFTLLVNFERYKTVTALNNGLMKKEFISIFINIGILIVLINANFQESGVIRSIAEGLPGGTEFFFVGDYSDLDRNWYSKVAIAIIVLIITNLISGIISTIISEIISFIKRRCFAHRQTLQYDMNQCMTGTEFNVAYKYSLTLSIIYMTIMYFGPIPILIPICAVYLGATYWVDKITFVRFCKIPPYFSHSIHMTAMNILPFSLILH